MQTWRKTFAADWKLILIGSLVTFFLASIFTSGLREGLTPDLSRPYAYFSDSVFHAFLAQRVTEGWLFENARSGYPFGSSFLDFPGSDTAGHFLIKVLSLLGGGWPAGVNLFFLLGFVVCFVATYVTARAFGLNRSFALTTSVLYTFLPFHFLRIIHLFYTWYFVAPIFFYLALNIYLCHQTSSSKKNKRSIIGIILSGIGMLIISSFGVYYALFGVVILSVAGLMNFIMSKKIHGIKKSLFLIAAISIGVLINIAPNIIGTFKNGVNPEVAQRNIVESELYALKMMQLLMPRSDHRVAPLAGITQRYNSVTPLINENATSSLGVIGSAGFILALAYLIFVPIRNESDIKLRLLAAITLVLFLFATIGGLGSLFAMVVSPSIRAWNRISVFIACGALLFFFVALQVIVQKKFPQLSKFSMAFTILLLIIGLFDQTAPVCKSCNASAMASFDSDKKFVEAIEKSLPSGGAVYQLPYIRFPEEPYLNRLQNYQMTAGFLFSKTLHWSFGGMKGRPGDFFYRALSTEPMTRQIEVIKKLGFAGIYIDRRGYVDNGEILIKEVSNLLNQQPLLQSDDKELVFFKLKNSENPDLSNMSIKEIMHQAGYIADALGPRYPGNLESGIDFSKSSFPDFISTAKGLHAAEPWGRWSSGSKVVFDFTQTLPKAFTLVLKAQGFAANSQKPTRVIIGNREYNIQLSSNASEVRLDVDLEGSSAEQITFIPPKPVSPSKVSASADTRIIGIGFVSMQILKRQD